MKHNAQDTQDHTRICLFVEKLLYWSTCCKGGPNNKYIVKGGKNLATSGDHKTVAEGIFDISSLKEVNTFIFCFLMGSDGTEKIHKSMNRKKLMNNIILAVKGALAHCLQHLQNPKWPPLGMANGVQKEV